MAFPTLVVMVLGIFVLITIATAIVIIPENQRGALLRLGRYLKALKPGIHVRVPLIDLVTKVDLDSSIPGWQGMSERELDAAVESFATLGGVVRAKSAGARATSPVASSSGTPEAQALAAWLLKTASEQVGVDLSKDPIAKQRLVERASSAAGELSSSDSCEIHLPFITADETGPKHFSTSLTRSRLDEILRR